MRIILLEPDANLANEYLERIGIFGQGAEVVWLNDASQVLENIDDNGSRGVGIIMELQPGVSNSLELLSELCSYEDSAGTPVLLAGFISKDLVKPVIKNFPNVIGYYLKTEPNPVDRFDKLLNRLIGAIK